MSVVVIIVGVLLAMGLRAYEGHLKRQRVVVTKENMEELKGALIRFVDRNGRLPCPASLKAAPQSEGYGKENCAGGAGVFEAEGARDVDGVPGNDPVLIGAIPFVELGVSSVLAQDGYGRRLTYAVTRKVAETASGFDRTHGAIALVDRQGNEKTEPPGSGLYSIISHGADGRGAYSGAGNIYRPCDGQGYDLENCEKTNGTFVITHHGRNTVIGVEHLDDFMTYDSDLNDNPLRGVSCAIGEVLTGFDSDGQLECRSMVSNCATGEVGIALGDDGAIICRTLKMSCPKGELMRGIKKNGDALCSGEKDDGGTSKTKCKRGEVMKGLNRKGEAVCVADKTGSEGKRVACGKGEVMKGIKADGGAICVAAGNDGSNQAIRCEKGKVMLGVNKKGEAICGTLEVDMPCAKDAPRMCPQMNGQYGFPVCAPGGWICI